MRRLLLLLILVSCFPRVGERLDAGREDSDAGPVCADGVRNGAESDVDCGGPTCTPCQLTARCDGPADCESGVCRTNQCLSPAQPCPDRFAGCATFVDLTDAGATRVRFDNGNHTYAPKCLRVRLGQTVTFTGDFGSHPINQACGPANGVIHGSGSGAAAITFDSALGSFGFYCSMHGAPSGAGMAGAVEVVR